MRYTPSMGDLAKQLLELEPEARLEIIRVLWASLVDEGGDALPLDEATKAELERRLAQHEADPSSALSWDEVKREALRDP